MAKETATERLFRHDGFFSPGPEEEEPETTEVGQPQARSALAFLDSLKDSELAED